MFLRRSSPGNSYVSKTTSVQPASETAGGMQGSLYELKSAPMTQITLSRTRLVGWLLLQGCPVLALACVGHVASAAPGTGHTVHASPRSR